MNGIAIFMKTQSWSTNRSREWNEQIQTYSKHFNKKKCEIYKTTVPITQNILILPLQ